MGEKSCSFCLRLIRGRDGVQGIRLNQPFAMLDYRVHARVVVSTILSH